MATFRLNIGRIRGCPAPAEVVAAMEEFGLPDTEEYGVLQAAAAGQAVSAAIVRKTNQVVQRLDARAREVTAESVERATLYPFTIRPRRELLGFPP